MLTTARMLLTPLCADDHSRLLALWRTPAVREFLFDGETLSETRVAEIIAGSEKDFATAQFGMWALRDVTDPEFLFGTAGLRRLDDGPELEVVYSLAPEHWGRGLALEAAQAVVAYAFGTLHADRVLAEVDEGNVASAAVARRLGMRPIGSVPGVLGPMHHYAIDNPECSPRE